jgi:hypothetical protein
MYKPFKPSAELQRGTVDWNEMKDRERREDRVHLELQNDATTGVSEAHEVS